MNILTVNTKSTWKQYRWSLLVGFTVAVFLTACTQPDGPVGSSVGYDPGGRTAVASFNVDFDTSFAGSRVSTGASQYLYVGSAYGITTEALMLFSKPSLPYEWSVNSGWIELVYEENIGRGWFPALKGYLIFFNWSESNPPDKIPVLPFQTTRPQMTEIPGDSGAIVFPVTQHVITDWFTDADSIEIDTTGSGTSDQGNAKLNKKYDFGNLTLKVSSQREAGRLVRFWSRNTTVDTLKPRLFVSITARDSADGELYPDTLTIYPTADAFIIRNQSTDIGDDLVIGSGVVFETDVRFDLNDMWTLTELSDIVVNRAVLTLYRKCETFSYLPPTPSILPFKLTDDMWLTDPTAAGEAGFTNVSTPIDSEVGEIEVVVTSPATEWITGVENNHGVALHSGGVGLDIDRMAFYSSKDTDSTKHPKLTIYYTEFPK